jgi:hypothetical protein
LYTLSVTDSKRQLVYDKNSKFVSTKAYEIGNEKLLSYPSKL